MPLGGEEYIKTELSMTAAEANVRAVTFIVPIMLLYGVAYWVVWPEQFSTQHIRQLAETQQKLLLLSPFVLLLVFVVGAAVHELLHGLTWAAFCRDGFRSIKFGVHWKMLTPYCHCKEVLPLRHYALGGMMPGLVMGLLPALAGIAMGHFLLFLFGLFFSMAAAGDLLILWMLRHQQSSDLVQDHPDKIGCYVLTKV
ncbi:putative zincin peptidase [Pontibacter ramchanderi]|uniref:Putative zincin peptidase n=2 Tax=Pontibacter ramchanderi TaxID=1179743 RepID=A0A2N3U8X1_9BACT|nr:putative zincin peptidase [Pontibacter ramchanderi]